MAFSMSGGKGLGSRKGQRAALAEINITPFVDVVLVLLIIFMLTAHVMEFGIEVDVPATKYVQDTAKVLPVVTITKDGASTLNGKPVPLYDLANAVRLRYGKVKGVYVRADKDTIWDPIAQVVAELGHAGIQVNMVTQPEDSARGR